jgi:hypothetical protein
LGKAKAKAKRKKKKEMGRERIVGTYGVQLSGG